MQVMRGQHRSIVELCRPFRTLSPADLTQGYVPLARDSPWALLCRAFSAPRNWTGGHSATVPASALPRLLYAVDPDASPESAAQNQPRGRLCHAFNAPPYSRGA